MFELINSGKYTVNRIAPFYFLVSTFLALIQVQLSAQDSSNNSMSTSKATAMYRSIEFRSEGATLRGRLYTPNSHSTKLPVIIMAHGYSATIEGMVADRYAEVFSNAGFAVLLYDHRNLGISDGEPRQEINR